MPFFRSLVHPLFDTLIKYAICVSILILLRNSRARQRFNVDVFLLVVSNASVFNRCLHFLYNQNLAAKAVTGPRSILKPNGEPSEA